MNETLVYYSSIEELSLKVTDIANVFILPLIGVIGIICNLLSILIISNQEIKGEMYKYMLINSFADLFYLLVCLSVGIIRCGRFCSIGYKYEAKIFELYVYLFVGNVLLLFNNLVNIHMAFRRLISFSKSSKKQNIISIRVTSVVVVLISILLNIPNYIISREVSQIGILVDPRYANITETSLIMGEPIYSVKLNLFNKSNIAKVFLSVINILRGLIVLILLFILNIIIAFKFRRHLKKKNIITKYSRKTKSKKFFLVKMILLYLNT